MPERWRPRSYEDAFLRAAKGDREQRSVGHDLDVDLRILADRVELAEGRVARGIAKVTGSLEIVTGLGTVTNVQATILSSTALNEWVTYALSDVPGSIILYVWQPTADNGAAADVTPIAGTVEREVDWQAYGTLS